MKCPVDSGTLLPWNKPPNYLPWFCPNNDTHGGNGRFFTNEDVEDFYAVEQLIEESVRAILDGTLTMEDAVTIIARRSKKPEAMVRARLATALKIARNFQSTRATKKSSAPTSMPAVNDSPPRTAGGTVAPDEFMAVLKERGLTKKQAAEAIGRSVSRVHELTVTKGGSQALLDSFKEKLTAYVPPTN